MSYSNSRYYANRVLRSGELRSAIESIASKIATSPETLHVDISRRLGDGSIERRTRAHLDDVNAVCDLVEDDTDIDVFLDSAFDGGVTFLRFTARKGLIEVMGSAPTADVLARGFTAVESALELTRSELPTNPREPKLVDLVERVDRLEREAAIRSSVPSPVAGRLRCFLSYRFTADSDLVVLQLQRFLSLLNVEVLTAVSYEPRPVSEKVVARLSSEVDFVILLVTAAGESLWTRDEIAFASGKSLSVVPVVERNATFAPGLFGDLEYIEYDAGHIGDAFMKIVEAVAYLRVLRDSASS